MGTKGLQIIELDCVKLATELKRAYADEWMTFYAYTYLGQVLSGGPEANQLAQLFLDTAKVEMEHQQKLAERIVFLGWKPVEDIRRLIEFSNKDYPNLPLDENDLDAVLKTVIQAEQDAIHVYNHLARETQGKDYITHNLIVQILAEEVAHEDRFERFLSRA
jgi:bacterioferritin